MATTPASKRNTPARRPAPKPKAKAVEMFEALTEPDENGDYDALVFGEQFRLNSDVNGFLLMLTGAGGMDGVRATIDLVKACIVVEPVENEDIEITREREKRRLFDLLTSQRHFGIESAMEFVNKMTEAAAGNDQ